MTVVFVDIETTGLDPNHHEIWEVALIEEGGQEHLWTMSPRRLDDADPGALRVNRYYERRPIPDTRSKHGEVALAIAELTAGQHLVGAVPSFDAAFLDVFLRQQGLVPAWHYHLVDVEALAAGWLMARGLDSVGITQGKLPWDSNDLSLSIGVNPDNYERHTALGDAQWTRAIYGKVMHG